VMLAGAYEAGPTGAALPVPGRRTSRLRSGAEGVFTAIACSAILGLCVPESLIAPDEERSRHGVDSFVDVVCNSFKARDVRIAGGNCLSV